MAKIPGEPSALNEGEGQIPLPSTPHSLKRYFYLERVKNPNILRKALSLVLALAVLSLALAPTAPWVVAADPDYFVTGRVQDQVGVPMMAVNVSAVNVEGGQLFTTFTDGKGNFSLTLPQGAYNISASIAELASNITYRQVLVSTDLSGLDFTVLVLTGVVEGGISSGNVPLIGAEVVLSNENATYTGTTALPLGHYSIAGVIPGVFVGWAELTGYWTNVSQAPVFVWGGDATHLDFVLEPQPARLYGKVTVGDGAEEGVEVNLLSGSSSVKRAVTDVNGNYSISNIIAGEYHVVFTKDGLIEKTYPVSISPFENKELSVSMRPEAVQGGKGFIDGLDLTHSLMVVGLIVAVLVMLFALFIRARAIKRPDLLAKEEAEEEEEEKEPKRPGS